jgi:hypothetical protein
MSYNVNEMTTMEWRNGQPGTGLARVMTRLRPALPLLALALVAAVWLSTLQRTVGAANDPVADPTGLVGLLLDDTGEFAVAWHTWGVTHPPGYPLLNASANIITGLFEGLGARPMVSASLVSLTLGLAALLALAQPLYTQDRLGLATAAAIALPATGLLVWLYASVAEAYTLGLLLAFAALAMALAVGARPTPRGAVLLGLLFGLAVGHHRTLVMLLPALIVAAWPARALGWRPWLLAALAVALAQLVYLYLPLAALASSPWIYGRSPLTWAGFSDALLAREYGSQLAMPPLADFGPALAERLRFLAQETTPVGLVLGLLGLAFALAWPRLRRPAATYGLAVAGYLLAPVGQYLLIGTHMLIMVASFALAALYGLGILALGATRPPLALVGLALALVIASFGVIGRRPTILSYSRDPKGEQLITAVAALPGGRATVVESWGPRYFALAFAKWASGELSGIELIDARAALSGLPPAEALPPTFVTTEAFMHLNGPEQWAQALGQPIALESAGHGLVAILRQPRSGDPPAENDHAIIIRQAEARLDPLGDVLLTVEWQATVAPAEDYHVFVHVSERAQIESPADIMAQGDRAHPVYGFYPTSRWTAGQLVRDDYRVTVGRDRRPAFVTVGLYTVNDDGSFVNHLSRRVVIE